MLHACGQFQLRDASRSARQSHWHEVTISNSSPYTPSPFLIRKTIKLAINLAATTQHQYATYIQFSLLHPANHLSL